MTLTNYNDLPGNSNKSKKEDRKHVDPVGDIPGKKKSKNILGRAIQDFIVSDSKTVFDYVLFDIVIPGLKASISDAGKGIIDVLFYGDRRRQAPTHRSVVDYTTRYVRPEHKSYSATDLRSRGRYDFDEIIFPSRNDAELAIDALNEQLEMYDSVPVSELMRAAGIKPSYSDEKWGWTSIQGANVSRVRDGYVIQLPKPTVLD